MEKVKNSTAISRQAWPLIIGFLLSLELTIGAYFLVVNEALSRRHLLTAIVGLAIAQLLVQLVFFLHLGRERRPRWNLTVSAFAALVLLILVLGSLWIMDSLSYNVMTPDETENYLLEEEALGR